MDKIGRLAVLFVVAAGLFGAACGAVPEAPEQETVTSALVRLENRAIALGGGHTCVILTDGGVKCWGWNDKGQLGLGNTSNRGDGPFEMGSNLPRVSLGTGRTAKALAAGTKHTCALLDNNQIKCWGLNDFGQLGVGNQSNRGDGPGEMGNNLPQVILGAGLSATAVAAGLTFSCALVKTNINNATGQIKCWGINTHGCLGLGLSTATTPFRSSPSTSPSSGQVNFGSGRSVKSFALGSYHGCAILDNDQVKCWGSAYLGQLGLGNMDDHGEAASQLGDGLPYTPVGTAQAIDAGGHHTCALGAAGLKCWGANQYGQLGIGNTNTQGDDPGEVAALPVVPLPTGIFVGPSAGRGEDAHTCIIGTLSEVRCWGLNQFGSLGIGATDTIGDDPDEIEFGPYADLGSDSQGNFLNSVAIGTGASHTCAGLAGGTLKCWGLNDHGQLGLGHTRNISDEFGETGNAIPIVNVGN